LTKPLVIRTLLVDESAEFLVGASLWIVERPELTVVGKARSGPEALQAVARLEPDLVIMDCVLPELDGFRVARAIKARPSPPLVVIATFVTSATAHAEALAAGADGFIAKDEFAEGLERFLDEVLERRSGARGVATSPETRDRRGSRIEPDR
jgi:DNA-binding NarL/FixJ family response regulator